MCGRFFESPSSLGLGPAKRGIPSAVSKEALLMRENKAQRHTSERRSPCEINHLFGGAPCPKAAKENVDGLHLCERHALEAKLEGQIECWGGILFHIELRSRDTSLGPLGSAERVLRRGPLKRDHPPLPPRGARPLFPGLRRHRRR